MKLNSQGKNLLKKAAFIVVFSILLYIPLSFIAGIVHNRNNTSKEVENSIWKEWGGKQNFGGPFLIVPYNEEIIEEEQKQVVKNKRKKIELKVKKIPHVMIVLPDDLNAEIELADEVKKRGIYKTIVYNGNLKLKGSFNKVLKSLPENAKIDYENIVVGMSIGDLRSLSKVKKFSFSGEKMNVEPGTMTLLPEDYNLEKMPSILRKGVSAKINLTDKEDDVVNFDIEFSFKGSRKMELLAFGKENEFIVKSTWKDPSFYGVLPDQKTIDEGKGFEGKWNISFLTKNYKQEFTLSGKIPDSLDESFIGVELYESITHYKQIIRAIKYGGLFIMLSLISVFLFELSSKQNALLIQYGIVGFSLVMFYFLLLSLSEHLEFNYAYAIATTAEVLPISFYIASITKKFKYGFGIFVLLSGIYAILFTILKMTDYALLTGTILIMVIVYLLMFLTRKLNNEEFAREEENEEEPKRKVIKKIRRVVRESEADDNNSIIMEKNDNEKIIKTIEEERKNKEND